VKEVIHLAGTAKDTELTNCIVDADKWIDNELKEYTTVPLTSTPTMVNVASKYKAAALFREREETEQEITEWQRFERRAEATLRRYIEKTYFLGGMRS